MLQGVSWLLLGWEGIYSWWFWQVQGARCTLWGCSHYCPLPKRRLHKRATWRPLVGLLWFVTAKAGGCPRKTLWAKDLQRKNDRHCVECTWKRAGELKCQALVQPREEGESLWPLLLSTNSYRNQFHHQWNCENNSTCFLRWLWRWKWVRLDYGTPLRTVPANCSADNLAGITAQALGSDTAILRLISSV